jgi:hypothetical protein
VAAAGGETASGGTGSNGLSGWVAASRIEGTLNGSSDSVVAAGSIEAKNIYYSSGWVVAARIEARLSGPSGWVAAASGEARLRAS